MSDNNVIKKTGMSVKIARIILAFKRRISKKIKRRSPKKVKVSPLLPKK